MKHYLDDNGFIPDFDIPGDIIEKFLPIFVYPNVEDGGKVNASLVLDRIFEAEKLQYDIMHTYSLHESLRGRGGNPTVESILEYDETKMFILSMLKLFIANGFIPAEFPLFLHHTLMRLVINLYEFKD